MLIIIIRNHITTTPLAVSTTTTNNNLCDTTDVFAVSCGTAHAATVPRTTVNLEPPNVVMGLFLRKTQRLPCTVHDS
jgi:hypothetical protein